MRVGIVAEGKSEWLVLEEILQRVFAEVEVERLHPDYTGFSGLPTGWRGVKAWCLEYNSSFGALMRGIKSRQLDLLIVHVDCSMADKLKAQRPCPPPAATADELRRALTKQWLATSELPSWLVLVTPSKTTDAWVVATLDPDSKRLPNLECDFGIEDELVERGYLRRREGRVKKPEDRYRPLAQRVGRQLERVRQRCSEADRFIRELRAATPYAAQAGQ